MPPACPFPRRLRLAAVALFLPVLVSAAESSTTPAPQRGQAWLNRHEGFVAEAKRGNIEVLFLGDSITDNWRVATQGRPVWEKHFAPLRSANFGISGDRTQHLLWRIEQGAVAGLSPKVVVLLIGTNNTGWESDLRTPRNSPGETVAGVTRIVETLRARLPGARILLHALFPRADEKGPPPGEQIPAINTALARLADGRMVHFLDVGSRLVDASGAIRRDLMPDLLHLSTAGYEVWAEALREPLARLLAGSN